MNHQPKCLEVEGLFKSFHAGEENIPVLQGASLKVRKGESVALLGASGSGKSTFLHCSALLESVDQGQVLIEGLEVQNLSRAERARTRLEKIGFVFQFHHLIPELTVLENVDLPSSLLGQARNSDRARELLDWVGLSEKSKRFPWQLSGGEQQRVAVARALVNHPAILFTDEATGNLDRSRATDIVELLLRSSRDFGAALVSVTHDSELAQRYQKRYRLKDGRIWDWLEHDT